MDPWETFLARLPAPPPDDSAILELQPLLRQTVATGHEAWPALQVPLENWVAHLAEKVAASAEALALALAGLHAADLYLACACALNHGDAVALFERTYFPEVQLARMRRSDLALERDDVEQLVRQRLLVAAPGRRARIADYSGRGSLRNWFRVAVVRLIANEAARPAREVAVHDEALAAFSALTADPELEYMKRFYRAELQASLSDALGQLSERERKLLRHSLMQGLTIDELAVIYGAHRATVARWIVKARTSLFERFREALMQRLQVGPAELDSILRLIQSSLDITMERLFGTANERP
jgi:RNA polymerase sigma-70 factor (ECF subfamily)